MTAALPRTMTAHAIGTAARTETNARNGGTAAHRQSATNPGTTEVAIAIGQKYGGLLGCDSKSSACIAATPEIGSMTSVATMIARCGAARAAVTSTRTNNNDHNR